MISYDDMYNFQCHIFTWNITPNIANKYLSTYICKYYYLS